MRRACILLATALVAGCCGTSRSQWGPRCLTPEAEALAGARAAPVVEARHGGVLRDAAAEERMERLGVRLARHSGIQGRYQYRLLRSGKLNAASLPGGRVYITRGLYECLETDEQVAAVLAHEMAHIAARDHFKPRCRSWAEAVNREVSADCLGAEYLQRAGLEPRAMIEVVRLITRAQPAGWSAARVRSLVDGGLGVEAARYVRPGRVLGWRL